MVKIRIALITLLSLLTMTLLTGCGGELTPYETNNADNYSVSVKYDANGGTFTTNTSVIVDSYNVNDLEKNSENNVEIALLSPDNESRGNDAFTAVNNGYFLAGWYAGREEIKDENGNDAYTYSDKWDFDTELLTVDVSGTYSADEPVLTLYAAWVPLFEIEFYDLESGDLLDSLTFDPNAMEEITIPAWDEETGAIEMYDFPVREGYTFEKAYYDEDGKKPIKSASIDHPGSVDLETGTAVDRVLKLYVDWTEGEWYHIYNVEQFVENASVNGNYEIHADLDFADEIWPTSFMYGNFNGVINGNGHVMKNITFEQTKNSKVNAGLFGYLTEESKIKDLTFKNVTFTIEAGTRVVGTSYGLLAGTISSDATLKNVKILGSTLQIDTSCYFGVDDYSIGLVCGMGNPDMVKKADIECKVVGEDPDSMIVTVNDNEVTIEYAAE